MPGRRGDRQHPADRLAPALAAGCTIVHKPAEWSPLSAVILCEMMTEVFAQAGLPAGGVVNLVHGFGETAGKALTEHPAIKAIAFVGESITGSHIMVWVNSENVRHLPTPFGGVKASGIGRDGGEYAFEVYMEQKSASIGLDGHSIPRLGA